MKDNLEILVGLEGSNKAQLIRFEDLYPIKERIHSIMFLWNANCYYVDRVTNTFIINGGRRIQFPELGECVIEYRKRTTLKVTTTGSHEPQKEHVWLMGLKSKKETMVLLEVTQNGKEWTWRNAL